MGFSTKHLSKTALSVNKQQSSLVITPAGRLTSADNALQRQCGKIVASDKWHEIKPDQWLLIRRKGHGGVLYLQMLDNALRHPATPYAVVGSLDGKKAFSLLRKQIRSLATTLSPALMAELAASITGRR
jgi:hypothetical protein